MIISNGGPGPDRMSGGDLPGYPATYGFYSAHYSWSALPV